MVFSMTSIRESKGNLWLAHAKKMRIVHPPQNTEPSGMNRTTRRLLEPPLPQGPLSRQVERLAFRHQKWLPWIHAAMFAGFLVLIGLPLALPAPTDDARLFENFTLTANFLI